MRAFEGLRFLVPLLLLAASPSPGAPFVVGGDIVTQPSPLAQSTVRLVILGSQGERSICSGSLLSPALVLTAAHCLDEDPLIVRIDFWGNRGLEESRLGHRYLLHPQWEDTDSERRSDLALLYFQGGIPAENAPVTLLPDSALGEFALIAGYGVFSAAEGAVPDDHLRHTTLQIAGRSHDCVELKAAAHPASACVGDSGGPAFLLRGGKFFLWGVASYVSQPYCAAGSFYMDLTEYRQWLAGATTALESAPALPPTPLKPIAAREFARLVKAFEQASSDKEKIKVVEAFGSEPAKTALDASQALELLLTFSSDGSKFAAFQAMAPRLRFDSLRQARTLCLIFDDEGVRAQALSLFPHLRFGYLRSTTE